MTRTKLRDEDDFIEMQPYYFFTFFVRENTLMVYYILSFFQILNIEILCFSTSPFAELW